MLYRGPDPLESRIREELLTYEDVEGKLGLKEIGPLAIKYVGAWLAAEYAPNPTPLKISTGLNMTWGTGTYVAPLSTPVSSGMYGRIGVVAEFDPSDWTFLDATRPRSRNLYAQWVQAQPGVYDEVLMTVHALWGNAYLRNTFRERYGIDCILFPPDQTGDQFTRRTDIWMCVADFDGEGKLRTDFSSRLPAARLAVLLDEEFDEAGNALAPQRRVTRFVEPATRSIGTSRALPYRAPDDVLAREVARQFHNAGFVHYYIRP